MRKPIIRDSNSIVKSYGYVELSAACIKANQTGYFSLNERIAPDSYDGNDTNINRAKLFFGGRRIELALSLQDVTKAAAKSASESNGNDSGVGIDSGSDSES